MGNSKAIKGIITEYNFERGFGFITEIENETSYFFHISNVDKNIKIIPNKTEVVFKVIDTAKGQQAISIIPYTPKIEGEFAVIELPNTVSYMTNVERIEFLEQQQGIICNVLNALSSIGIKVAENKNGWITLDSYEMEELENPKVSKGNSKRVPNGYPKTFEHLIKMLQKQINEFNYDLANTKKGIKGEEKTLNALKSITLSYPILKNIRLEESIKYSSIENEKYSAETDLFIITNCAIFLIETKNYGSTGDTIFITNDEKWLIFNKHGKKEYTLPNPFKQTTDHIFLLKKFLDNNNVNLNLPIIPIIALANDDVSLRIESKEDLYAKVMSADLVGSYILKYLDSNKSLVNTSEIEDFKKLLNDKTLLPKSYPVIDYCENIKAICNSIKQLLSYLKKDIKIAYKEEQERKHKEEIKRLEEIVYNDDSYDNAKTQYEKTKFDNFVEKASFTVNTIRLFGRMLDDFFTH